MDRTGLGQKELRVVKVELWTGQGWDRKLRVVKVELWTGQGRDWKVKYVFQVYLIFSTEYHSLFSAER